MTTVDELGLNQSRAVTLSFINHMNGAKCVILNRILRFILHGYKYDTFWNPAASEPHHIIWFMIHDGLFGMYPFGHLIEQWTQQYFNHIWKFYLNHMNAYSWTGNFIEWPGIIQISKNSRIFRLLHFTSLHPLCQCDATIVFFSYQATPYSKLHKTCCIMIHSAHY